MPLIFSPLFHLSLFSILALLLLFLNRAARLLRNARRSQVQEKRDRPARCHGARNADVYHHCVCGQHAPSSLWPRRGRGRRCCTISPRTVPGAAQYKFTDNFEHVYLTRAYYLVSVSSVQFFADAAATSHERVPISFSDFLRAISAFSVYCVASSTTIFVSM